MSGPQNLGCSRNVISERVLNRSKHSNKQMIIIIESFDAKNQNRDTGKMPILSVCENVEDIFTVFTVTFSQGVGEVLEFSQGVGEVFLNYRGC